MNKIIFLFIFLVFNTGCSFNSNSKFWTKSENIIEENSKEIFAEEKASDKELNSNLKIDLKMFLKIVTSKNNIIIMMEDIF